MQKLEATKNANIPAYLKMKPGGFHTATKISWHNNYIYNFRENAPHEWCKVDISGIPILLRVFNHKIFRDKIVKNLQIRRRTTSKKNSTKVLRMS